MHGRFRNKLMVTMIGFAVIVSLAVSLTDQIRLKNQLINANRLQVERIEEAVEDALEATEKAYMLFGNDLAMRMEAVSQELSALYRANPDLDEWDFQALKERFGFDIYLINADHVITHSSNVHDIGLNFRECCGKLASILEERRKRGGFYHDGIDLEQVSGEIKKYSYMATPDRKYLIQLSVSLKDDLIFQEFHPLRRIDQLTAKYPSVNEINVFNIGGIALGKPADTGRVSRALRPLFEHTLQTGETTETRGEWRGKPAVFRFVHYASPVDTGTTGNKVIGIVYNENELTEQLAQARRQFAVQLAVVLVIAVILSFVISGWVARPMYLAFHDPLTGLYNRAFFEEQVRNALRAQEGTIALLMIDLDNFKQVNDTCGHDAGDALLKSVAQRIRSAVRKEDSAFRLGGDEFTVLMRHADERIAQETAARIIDAVRDGVGRQNGGEREDAGVSVSIGIALAPRHARDPDALMKQADRALYAAKAKGKNQLQMCRDEE
jgi:diguanylate cyclase (GGDEF)-like protein